ncbi:hypothetical protein NHP190002_06530 [Helicobacter ailurogastricus]|uniref:hypothetical protein n=1 Tax=Helicobacter ailurogastricus TaxID=1578720 RepID=UPI00244D84C1|nr:hypothetical protein [Helicobacter ailurogastricus]GMB89972.1 hypothetical protein NHP190002_06530 [Helicobacter ailurogastricus]
MKVLALILCPWVFFVLRQDLVKAFFVWFLPLLVSLIISMIAPPALGGIVGLTVSITWVTSTPEYKSFGKLPKGTFLSMFFPFATLFKYEHKVSGWLSLATWVGFLGILFLFLDSISEVSEAQAGTVIFNFFAYMVCFGIANLIFAVRALTKCIGASPVGQKTQAQTPQIQTSLKTKIPKEIKNIQASLEDLPIDKMNPY